MGVAGALKLAVSINNSWRAAVWDWIATIDASCEPFMASLPISSSLSATSLDLEILCMIVNIARNVCCVVWVQPRNELTWIWMRQIRVVQTQSSNPAGVPDPPGQHWLLF